MTSHSDFRKKVARSSKRKDNAMSVASTPPKSKPASTMLFRISSIILHEVDKAIRPKNPYIFFASQPGSFTLMNDFTNHGYDSSSWNPLLADHEGNEGRNHLISVDFEPLNHDIIVNNAVEAVESALQEGEFWIEDELDQKLQEPIKPEDIGQVKELGSMANSVASVSAPTFQKEDKPELITFSQESDKIPNFFVGNSQFSSRNNKLTHEKYTQTILDNQILEVLLGKIGIDNQDIKRNHLLQDHEYWSHFQQFQQNPQLRWKPSNTTELLATPSSECSNLNPFIHMVSVISEKAEHVELVELDPTSHEAETDSLLSISLGTSESKPVSFLFPETSINDTSSWRPKFHSEDHSLCSSPDNSHFQILQQLPSQLDLLTGTPLAQKSEQPSKESVELSKEKYYNNSSHVYISGKSKWLAQQDSPISSAKKSIEITIIKNAIDFGNLSHELVAVKIDPTIFPSENMIEVATVSNSIFHFDPLEDGEELEDQQQEDLTVEEYLAKVHIPSQGAFQVNKQEFGFANYESLDVANSASKNERLRIPEISYVNEEEEALPYDDNGDGDTNSDDDDDDDSGYSADDEYSSSDDSSIDDENNDHDDQELPTGSDRDNPERIGFVKKASVITNEISHLKGQNNEKTATEARRIHLSSNSKKDTSLDSDLPNVNHASSSSSSTPPSNATAGPSRPQHPHQSSSKFSSTKNRHYIN